MLVICFLYRMSTPLAGGRDINTSQKISIFYLQKFVWRKINLWMKILNFSPTNYNYL